MLLQKLKNLVGNPNPSASGTDEIFKYLKKIDDNFPLIKPKKPKADAIDISATPDSWYTLTNVVSGSGILSKIVVASRDSNEYIEIRVTIDGVASTLSVSSENNARGLMHSVTSVVAADFCFDYNTQTFFESSLLIEVRILTGIASTALEAISDYSLV